MTTKPGNDDRSFETLLEESRSQTGRTLRELSAETPLLVVFLRHGGCPFCRQTLSDLREQRSAIESGGTRVALVHMMTEAEAAELFVRYGLEDLPRFSDPDRRLYSAFGLRRESAWKVMGPAAWWQGFRATILGGHRPGSPKGDVFQMPGAFLLVGGEVVARFEHERTGDRPDYVELATCERPPG